MAEITGTQAVSDTLHRTRVVRLIAGSRLCLVLVTIKVWFLCKYLVLTRKLTQNLAVFEIRYVQTGIFLSYYRDHITYGRLQVPYRPGIHIKGLECDYVLGEVRTIIILL